MGPMPPKDASKDCESKEKTETTKKKWNPVSCTPPEEANKESEPKQLRRKGKHPPTNTVKETPAKVPPETPEVALAPPKLGKNGRRRGGGRPVVKKGPAASKEPLPMSAAGPRATRATRATCSATKEGASTTGTVESGLAHEVDACQVEGIPEQLFRRFFSQGLDTQEFVGLMRLKAIDKTMRRIHEVVVGILLDDFQRLPYWPEKELLMVGELLGQLIRWELIPHGEPLQKALCCILSALKEPTGSILYRFGHRALEQFLSELDDHDVASEMWLSIHISQRQSHKEEELKKEERLLFNPIMLHKQQVVLLWPPSLLQNGLDEHNLLIRMMLPQVFPVPSGFPNQNAAADLLLTGSRRLNQTEEKSAKWLGNASKAAGSSRGTASKQGPSRSTTELEKEKREARTSKKKSSGKNKKAANSEVESAGRAIRLPVFMEVEMDSMHFHLEAEDLEIFEEWRPSSTNEEDGELLSEDDVLDSQAQDVKGRGREASGHSWQAPRGRSTPLSRTQK